MDCVFCKVLSGEVPGTFTYRDEAISAFMDIQPVNPGHLIIVPNAHVALLGDLPDDVGARIFRLARVMGAALRASGLRCEGVNLFLADGEAAMQEVPHLHLHVIPRFVGDGFGLKFAERYYHKPPRSEIESAADRITAALGRLRD